jgi:hypothetical protein
VSRMNVPVLRPKDAPLVPKLRKLGIKMPIRMLIAAHNAAIPPSLAASVLMQETSGGANIFGHDPTIFAGAGDVTKAKYLAYKKQRGPKGEGGMQGVGPLQLTFFSLQDEADDRGGCWKPYVNMLVGFEHLAANIRRGGMHEGVKAYNGSGSDAEKYANTVLPRADGFKQVLGR